MLSDGDAVARLVLNAYSKLGRNGKPGVRSNGVREWTVLAGIVVSYSNGHAPACVALATGVKASPEAQIRGCGGVVLHDCHAEVLAIRAFNRYVLDAGAGLGGGAGLADVDGVYLYVSAPPCGDASMSTLNGGASWTAEPPPPPGALIRGRGHYNVVGRMRTKPGRTDAQLTMSKSCSDKLCLRQSRGLLLCPLRRLLAPQNVFLTALVCPVVLADFERAFARWSPQHRFACVRTSLAFEAAKAPGAVPSTCSIVWTPQRCEVLNNGVRQGSKNRPSCVSRAELVRAAVAAAPERFADVRRYSDLKRANAWPAAWPRTQSTAPDDFDVCAHDADACAPAV